MRKQPLCKNCKRRPARSKFRGKWRVMRHHDLCRQCFESMIDSYKAYQLRLWAHRFGW